MIKEGNCLTDLKLLGQSNLQSKGTAFDFVEFEMHHSRLMEAAKPARDCMAQGAIAIFWFPIADYEIVKVVARSSGFSIDVEPSVWIYGERPSWGSYHSAYKPFLVGCVGKPNWHREIKRGNVFHYPNRLAEEPGKDLMKDILRTFIRKEKGNVLIPNCVRASTILACKDLGHDHMAWGSILVRTEVEAKWRQELARQEVKAIRAKL